MKDTAFKVGDYVLIHGLSLELAQVVEIRSYQNTTQSVYLISFLNNPHRKLWFLDKWLQKVSYDDVLIYTLGQ